MKIYTKKGDGGETSLISGQRVSKADIRIESYGTVDELNSYIGVVMEYIKDAGDKDFLLKIQNELFVIGSHLAAGEDNKYPLPKLKEEQVSALEQRIDLWDKSLPELKFFILPSGDISVAHCHVARCICRRAERITVALAETGNVDPMIIRYLNRLSDLLFTLARILAKSYLVEETAWKPQ